MSPTNQIISKLDQDDDYLIRRKFRADKFSRTFRFRDFKNLIYGNTNEKQGVGFAQIYLWFFCVQKWRNSVLIFAQFRANWGSARKFAKICLHK